MRKLRRMVRVAKWPFMQERGSDAYRKRTSLIWLVQRDWRKKPSIKYNTRLNSRVMWR